MIYLQKRMKLSSFCFKHTVLRPQFLNLPFNFNRCEGSLIVGRGKRDMPKRMPVLCDQNMREKVIDFFQLIDQRNYFQTLRHCQESSLAEVVLNINDNKNSAHAYFMFIHINHALYTQNNTYPILAKTHPKHLLLICKIGKYEFQSCNTQSYLCLIQKIIWKKHHLSLDKLIILCFDYIYFILISYQKNNRFSKTRIIKDISSNSAKFELLEGLHNLVNSEYIDLINYQNKNISTTNFKMQQTLIHLRAQTQDFQVHSQTCCQAIIKSKKSSQQTHSASPRSMKNHTQKEKGIKLISSKSNIVLNPTKKINIDEKTTTWGSSQKIHLKKINSTHPTQLLKQAENINNNVTKKCIEYKNRRIMERINTQSSYLYAHIIDKSSIRSQQKTKKFTPRTEAKTQQDYVELSQLVDKNYQFSMILANKNHEKLEIQDPQKFFKPSKSKKRLSRLYEQKLGRRVMTVQSQQNESQSDNQSIVEPFEWKVVFN